MKYPYAVMTVLGLLGSMMTPAHAANRNVESILESQSDLSMFRQALLTTGVADELDENTEYTIFAPTNAAFAAVQPHAYPCFYSAQCRVEVAAVLRNHIVPRNESINDLSKWGGNPIPTIGSRGLYVEETYKNQYTVEGHTVLHQSQGEEVSLYPIDGVIISNQELAQFRTQAVADSVGSVTEKTVTTYRTPGVSYPAYPIIAGGHAVPGGYPVTTIIHTSPDELSDDTTQTTTIIRTTTTQ